MSERDPALMLHRALLVALVAFAALPAWAAGLLISKQLDAPMWIGVPISALVPVGAVLTGWTLARKFGGRS